MENFENHPLEDLSYVGSSSVIKKNKKIIKKNRFSIKKEIKKDM